MPPKLPPAISRLRNLDQLSKSLLDNFGKSKRGRRKEVWGSHKIASFGRVDIIDEKACDDIVGYLAPTLEKHKGCTIIDVHPGASLFSQKIHNLVKPKWHLLMEPEERYYEPYIKPLLDAPGSTYRHTYLTGAHPKSYWENYRKLHEDPKLLPARPALPAGDPKLRQFNPSLLVIGNLERAYSGGHQRIDLSTLIMVQMPFAALCNELFHTTGLVRQLWWVPERNKNAIFPRGPMLRSSFSTSIEMGVQVTEAAGVTPLQVRQDESAHWRKRMPTLDRVGIEQVAQRMQESGMSAPEERKLLGVDYQEHVEVPEGANESPFDDLATTPEAIRTKLATARAHLDRITRMDKKLNEELLQSTVYPQTPHMLNHRISGRRPSSARVCLFVDVQLQVFHLEASYKALEEQDSTVQATLDALKVEILQLDDDLRARVFSWVEAERNTVLDVAEDMQAFYMEPQHSAFDRRAYEPLELSGKDFFPPRNDLCLLDLMPKTRDLSVPDLADNKEATRVCRELLGVVFSKKSASIVELLNSFAINAGQDLVPMVPIMSDVRKGGRLNPSKMRTRMITDEMTEGLVKAFFEWPFRPRGWEMAALGGSDEVDDGAGAGKEDGERDEGLPV